MTSKVSEIKLVKRRKKKGEKTSRWISLLFPKLYFSSTFNYLQLNYNNPNINISSFTQHFTCDFQKGSSMRFFKNASKKGKRRKNSRVRSWEGAPCFDSMQKKVAVESIKRKNIWFRSTSTWNEKLVSRTRWRDTFKISLNGVIVLKDITLTTQCFLVLFLLSLLQQVFNNIPVNEIIISIYN